MDVWEGDVIKLQIMKPAMELYCSPHAITHRENSSVQSPREIDCGQGRAGYAAGLELVAVMNVALIILANQRPVYVDGRLDVRQYRHLHMC